MQYDIVIIGSGPAGLSLAASLSAINLQVLIIEKQKLEFIKNPQVDGREIALTHLSKNILTRLGVWELINQDNISAIKKAIVLDESSDKVLNFDSEKLDTLGFLVSNFEIRKALYQKVKSQKNITIITENEVKYVENLKNEVIINLFDTQISAKLLVAADSRFSAIRRQVGINTSMRDFAKTMIVTNMTINKPHNGLALERFDFDKTIALLPMSGDKASFVLTVDNITAKKWLELSNEEFGKQTTQIFNNEFGEMKIDGKRHSYPLVGVFANKFIAQRFALLGDAAVGMHPVTAHGFNLGLKGADILASEIVNAYNHKIDIGDNYVLSRYQSKHIKMSKIMYFGTNIVINIFTNDSKFLRPLRKFAINIVSSFPPIKKAITHHLTSISQR